MNEGIVMKWRSVATTTVVAIVGSLAYVSPAAARSQLVSRPYDVEAVRKAAAEIQRESRKPSHQEEALGGPLQFIVESLTGLNDLTGVPDEVLDAVVALAGAGRMATDTLLRFGDRAANALIRSARARWPQPTYPGGAMDVLQEMLRRRNAAPGLSSESVARVRAMVLDVLKEDRLGPVELAALACLAVATSDPELRAAAERLTSPADLTSRGVPTASQAYVISRIRRALETLPKPPDQPVRLSPDGRSRFRRASWSSGFGFEDGGSLAGNDPSTVWSSAASRIFRSSAFV
jgi:hypothetical protein